MPDLSLDPSALTFNQPTLPTLPSKATLAAAQAAKNAAKPSNIVPRVDLEPLYASLKVAIGEHWAAYKEAVGLFVIGQINQNEFCLRTDHFLAGDTSIEHQHNQLLIGIFANVGRDQPEPGVAPWVSANDKPLLSSKPTAGDAAEQRLKTEVKQLQPRERRRLKEVPELDVSDPIPVSVTEYNLAKQFRSSDHVPPSAGGKTNWDLEIRKRFAQPLAAESGEFPDADVIQGRMIPICYGESLPNGAASSCAPFMATATEHFIKEVLSSIYSRTRSNITGGSVNGILTHRFKKQLQSEEDALTKGEIEKVAGTGLLPIENKETSTRLGLAMHDLKLALSVGDVGLGQYPLTTGRIMSSYDEGEYETYQARRQENVAWREKARVMERQRHAKLSGLGGDTVMADAQNVPTTNGVMAFHEDDNDDYGWDGGSATSRLLLADSIDSCLAIGS